MDRYTHFTIDHAGRRWSGDWRLVGKDVEVGSAYGSARAPCGRRKPENVAAELLRKLVETRHERRT